MLLLSTLLLAISTQAPIPPSIDSLTCAPMEFFGWHVHAHIGIVDHGKSIRVPKNIGIDVSAKCIYQVHTHTPDGVVHIEAQHPSHITVRTFFRIWDQPLSSKRVAYAVVKSGDRVVTYVNGDPYHGDPGNLIFAPHDDIEIVVGPPYAAPPLFTSWPPSPVWPPASPGK